MLHAFFFAPVPICLLGVPSLTDFILFLQYCYKGNTSSSGYSRILLLPPFGIQMLSAALMHVLQ